ncbi:MAG: TonB-dependent receptor [Rikenellaceae bacterium]
MKLTSTTFKSSAKMMLMFVLFLTSVSAFAQASGKMRGRVIDTNGEPVFAAGVAEQNASNAVFTNENGEFELNLKNTKNGISVIMSGYDIESREYTAEPVIITLTSLNLEMDEVVIVGYQKMRKGDITGSVASVKSSELNLTTPTVGQALVGKVAGVQISQVSGAPYESTKIRVRGTSSINASSDPLYVIDGYPSNNDLNLNPEDIESIEILKDAASAAIYGSRASGGVVLITTKRGKVGKPVVSYDYQLGINSLARKVDMLNSAEFVDLYIDAHNKAYKDLLVNSGKSWDDSYMLDSNAQRTERIGYYSSSANIPDSFYDFSTGKAKTQAYDTDWQDELYRTALNHRHVLSVNGGSENVQYNISGSFQDQEGIMLGTDQETFTLRSNIDAKVSDKFKIGTNMSYTHTTSNEVSTGRFHQSPTMAALVYLPIFSAYNEDGSYKKYEMASMSSEYAFQNNIENPLALATEIKNYRQTTRTTINVFGDYEIIPNLSAKLSLATYKYDEKYEYYRPTSLTYGTNAPYSDAAIAASSATSIMKFEEDYLAEFTLNYNYKKNDTSFSLLGGASAQKNATDIIDVDATGFENDKIQDIIGGGEDPSDFTEGGSTGKSAYTLLSAFGRANVGYKDRYHATASFRADGCSLFGPSNRWGYFPSVSAGWTISEEDFFVNAIGNQANLKLRASWGLSGNNGIGNYNYQQTMSKNATAIGGSIVTTMYPGSFCDDDLGWESTSQMNLGFDLSLFRGRLSVMANYYNSETFNLLYEQSISAISGSTSMLTNLDNSRIRNRGIDLQVDAKVISGKDFNLNVSANVSVNRNKVMDLGESGTILTSGAERSYVTHITQEGSPIGMFYGYKVAGMVTQADMALIAMDDDYYDSSSKNFPAGYELKGPARSTAQTTALQEGDLYFEDITGDGIVDENDKQIIGSPYADFTFGFNVSADYKNFDFSASFNGSVGNDILDGQCYYLFNMEGSGNQYQDAAYRYVDSSNQGNGIVYRASRGGTQSNSTRLSDFYLEDGSYLRCTNITFGYTWSNISKLTKNGISSLRAYVALDNPFTFQSYRGYNPDVDYGSGSSLSQGVDYGMYPLMKSTNLGVKLTF